MREKLKALYESYSIEELDCEIKRLSGLVKKAESAVQRSSLAMLNMPPRRGIRGGRNTSLQAKHQSNLDELEDLRAYLKTAKSVKNVGL